MDELHEVRVGVRAIERFIPVLGQERVQEALETARVARDRLSRRVVWNVNSTAVGGGVAEMLPALLGYTRALGIDSRWLVIAGSPEFFRVTKRLHHALHGSKGDGSELDERAHEVYERTLTRNLRELEAVVRPDDVMLLHDPQTAGLGPGLLRLGARVIWRCHIGL
ncbi:MAG: glycosyl transferase family 1, partial [Myxococcota bacterium]|nr:glycosyl transferase family 1 [Myxococcota bacterium]